MLSIHRRTRLAILALFIGLTLIPALGAEPKGKKKKLQTPVTKESGEATAVQKREEWFYSQRRPGSEGRMAELRMKAVAFTRAQEAMRREEGEGAGAGVWTARGPFGSTFGGWAFGRVSGRIPALAKDFTNNILYVGSASGGLWKSANDGASWTSIFDSAGTMTIGEVAVDPQNPNILWAGTGENSMSCSTYFGIGLLRSPDGGANWEIRNGTGASTLNDLSTFASIVIHPSNSNRLIVGGRYRDCVHGNAYLGGIFTTDDGGNTWTQRLSSKEVTEIEMDPSDPNILWAGCGNSGVYKSLDNGNAWTLQTALPTGAVRRVEVAIAPSDPSTVYALFESASGTPQFYQTTNGGGSWTLKSSGSNACDGQCGYNMVIRVHRTNPSIVYRGTIHIYKSSDGGATWSDLIGEWGGSQKVHQDIHEFLLDPSDPNVMYVGCDGGVWKTSNGGSSFANLNANLSLTQFYDIGIHPTDDGIILGGAQDNSSLARTTSDTWALQQVTGDGFVCAINPVTPSTVYIAGYPYNHGSGNVPSVFRSTSGVFGYFDFITDVSNGITAGERIAWVTPYTLDPSNPDTLFLGTHHGYRSADGGLSWISVGPSDMAGGSGTVSTLHVSRAGSSWVYAGTSTSRVWRSVDGGSNWSEISSGLPSSRTVTDIETDPSDGTRAFCTVSGFNSSHLYEYSGAAWVARGTGLPNVPANTLLMLSSSDILVGTDTGIFRSIDGGINFFPYNTGLAEGLVAMDLEYAPTTGTVTLGTYGRGTWQITVGPPTCSVTCTATVPGIGTQGATVSFQAAATPANCAGSPAWAWTFGDGGASTLQNPSHTYALGGTFSWSLTVTVDGVPCTRSGSIVITPPCALTCTETVPVSGSAGTPVSFQATATASNCAGSVVWAWTFGDGQTSSLQNPTHTYTSAGNYPWTLTVTVQNETCTQSGSISITPPCSVSCSATVPSAGTAGTPIPFQALATPSYCTGSPTYSWNFGDGESSAQKNTSHTYTVAGTYTWTLTATIQGQTCSTGGTLVIAPTCALTCTASASPTQGISPLTVSFAATAAADHCAQAPTFAWSFGDGASSTLQNPPHTYSAAGSYDWTLTATADGKTCTRSGSVTVTEPCAISCTASASVSTGTAPLEVNFSASATPSHCSGTPAYVWTFGDGVFSTQQNPPHTYTAAGTFVWTLTVTADEETCAQTGTVTVSEPCTLTCSAGASPATGVAPLTVAFTGAGTASNCTGAPASSWVFGDGVTSTVSNPNHTYVSPGSYGWTLTVTVDGKTCSQTGTVLVAAPCTVSCTASAAPEQGTAPLAVAFSSTATPLNCTGDIITAWTFGDGGASSEQNPNHTYANAGAFTWSCAVTMGGVTCQRTGTLTVLPGLPGDGNGDGVVSIGEVQQAINMFLGAQPPGNGVDCNGDGTVSIGEVQKVINGFLGMTSSC
jgi:PKD repeat protein